MSFGEVAMPATEHSAQILAGSWPSQSVTAWSGYAMTFTQAANSLFKELDVQMDIKEILAPMEGFFIDSARRLAAGRETALQNRIEAYRHIAKSAHWAANELHATKSDLVEVVNSAEESIRLAREAAENAKAAAVGTPGAPAAIAAIEAQLQSAIAEIVSTAKAVAQARDLQGATTVAALSSDIAQWTAPFANHALTELGGVSGPISSNTAPPSAPASPGTAGDTTPANYEPGGFADPAQGIDSQEASPQPDAAEGTPGTVEQTAFRQPDKIDPTTGADTSAASSPPAASAPSSPSSGGSGANPGSSMAQMLNPGSGGSSPTSSSASPASTSSAGANPATAAQSGTAANSATSGAGANAGAGAGAAKGASSSAGGGAGLGRAPGLASMSAAAAESSARMASGAVNTVANSASAAATTGANVAASAASAAPAAGSTPVGGAPAGGGAPMAMMPPGGAGGGVVNPIGNAAAPVTPGGAAAPPAAPAASAGGVTAAGAGGGAGAAAGGGGGAAPVALPGIRGIGAGGETGDALYEQSVAAARDVITTLVAQTLGIGYIEIHYAVALVWERAGTVSAWMATSEGASYIPLGVRVPNDVRLSVTDPVVGHELWSAAAEAGGANPLEVVIRQAEARERAAPGSRVLAVASSLPLDQVVDWAAVAGARPVHVDPKTVARATSVDGSLSHRCAVAMPWEWRQASAFTEQARLTVAGRHMHMAVAAGHLGGRHACEQVIDLFEARRPISDALWAAVNKERFMALIQYQMARGAAGLGGAEPPARVLAAARAAEVIQCLRHAQTAEGCADLLYAARLAGVPLNAGAGPR